ncbi:MAG: tetratricopeptide repeat protein [Candidatus Omnitrophica bacterium]|nr:tetratricopeptide repeat protein [Candidatus Omnitrophota bacterium]MDE2214914.1 tetratricopeptide repeat protein [Candidatus Omnitrophota bacterium]MDE2232351.1 tetratricopeptide repeat protein [Candidatus Omnitrophota bacterium]
MGKLWNQLHDRKIWMTAAVIIAIGLGTGGARAYAQDEDNSAGPPQQTVGSTAGETQAEQDALIKEIRHVEYLNTQYTSEIKSVRALLSARDADYQKRMQELEDQLAAQQSQEAKQQVVAQQSQATTQELEAKTNEMLSKGGDLNPEDKAFRKELAKAHYNMGNIYFEQGEYQRAVVEYYQAVDLDPNDPDTHYNLAFVSGEYLGDQETALKHYQMYLYLKPNASDKAAVQEKIIQARLSLRSQINSPIENHDGNFNLTR